MSATVLAARFEMSEDVGVARSRLEYHHEDPYARGGGRGVDNIRLLCRTHNQLMAERDFGKEWMEQFRRAPG